MPNGNRRSALACKKGSDICEMWVCIVCHSRNNEVYLKAQEAKDIFMASLPIIRAVLAINPLLLTATKNHPILLPVIKLLWIIKEKLFIENSTTQRFDYHWMTRQFCQQWSGQAFITSFFFYLHSQSCHFRENFGVFSSCDEFLVGKCSSVEVFTRPLVVLAGKYFGWICAVAFWTH